MGLEKISRIGAEVDIQCRVDIQGDRGVGRISMGVGYPWEYDSTCIPLHQPHYWHIVWSHPTTFMLFYSLVILV